MMAIFKYIFDLFVSLFSINDKLIERSNITLFDFQGNVNSGVDGQSGIGNKISQNSSFANVKNDAVSTGTVISGLEHQQIVKQISKQKNIQHNDIVKLVKINVFYLGKLKLAMQNSIFPTEYQKVCTLLEQSENCLQLLGGLQAQQIFYQKTIQFIYQHALQVGELTVHLKDVDISGYFQH